MALDKAKNDLQKLLDEAKDVEQVKTLASLIKEVEISEVESKSLQDKISQLENDNKVLKEQYAFSIAHGGFNQNLPKDSNTPQEFAGFDQYLKDFESNKGVN